MFESPELQAKIDKIMAWLHSHVWTSGNISQGGFILAAAILAELLHHFSGSKVAHFINGLHTFPRLKALLYNVRRLIFPFTWLILLFIGSVSGAADGNATNLDLISIVMNLLVAWIVIGLAVQFIGNAFVRNVFAFSIWSIAALKILGFLPAAVKALDSYSFDAGAFHLSALSLIKGLFTLCFLLYGAMFISSLIERQIRFNKSLTPSSKVLISKSIRAVLIVFALLIAVNYAGIDLSLLAALSGGIGLGIGFGLQKVVSNLLSGMFLLLDESIKPGDIIEMQDGAFGWVEKMGARYTEVVTHDFKSYLIPNETLVTQQVVNWSHGNTLIRLEVDFGVHYDSDPHAVKTVAKKAAAVPARIVAEPPPVCHLVQFGDNALNFKLRFWISDAENDVANIRSEVLLALWDAFKENGIKIPYPHRIVYLHKGGEEAA